MKLRPIDTPDLLLAAAALPMTPGAHLIGSSRDASLVLPPAADVGRIQAVIRVQEDGCSLETLSAKGYVQVNDRLLGARQSVQLLAGDRLQINQHSWVLEKEEEVRQSRAAAAAEQPVTIEDGVEAASTEADLFDGLLGGPGVVPVGAPAPPLPDGAESHILSDPRPTLLHHEEPEMLRRHDDIGLILEEGLHKP